MSSPKTLPSRLPSAEHGLLFPAGTSSGDALPSILPSGDDLPSTEKESELLEPVLDSFLTLRLAADVCVFVHVYQYV